MYLWGRKEVAKQTGEDVAGLKDPRKAQLKAMFSRLAGDDGEVDAEELQDILTTTLTKNMGGSVFSLDACRAMISMLDVSYYHIPQCLPHKQLLVTVNIALHDATYQGSVSFRNIQGGQNVPNKVRGCNKGAKVL